MPALAYPDTTHADLNKLHRQDTTNTEDLLLPDQVISMSDPKAPQESTDTATVFKRRPVKGKTKFRKRAVSLPISDSESDYSSFEDESGYKIKRRKKTNAGTLTVSSKHSAPSAADLEPTTFTAERSTTIKSSNDATKSSNWYDEEKSDSLSARNLLGTTRTNVGEQSAATYKGLANAATFITKNPNAPTRVVGPVKAPTNIRTITVTDFAPDVCKDYKQSGFCGFGDSCKYLHAREDYKHGWQLDREWENVTKGKKIAGGTTVASADRNAEKDDSEDDELLLDAIPFACIICRESYRDPIVTKCKHYFCEACALKKYRKNPSCAACGSGTGGVFNVAKRLNKLLDRKRERVQKRREKAIEAGEDVSDEEE